MASLKRARIAEDDLKVNDTADQEKKRPRKDDEPYEQGAIPEFVLKRSMRMDKRHYNTFSTFFEGLGYWYEVREKGSLVDGF
mmetsp:Transcript_12302/g.34685  ORF Transcript_12302/g.34685 Transcript_12302/m.34685 type:complete len:82 (-) Transcript_12302:493-738(-)